MNHPPLNLFLSACGSTEPVRVGVGQKDEIQAETRTFHQPFLVIGRRPESDLMLDHWQVSRRHTYLQLLDGRFYCVDLGSRTGTHGGDATERSGWLEEGRSIQIGPFAVLPEASTMVDRDLEPLPGVTWELPGRAIGQAVWRMDRNLVLVGRSPACRIRIVETDVSKFHCSLVLTRLGVWAVDLLGQNGMFVNGEEVRCARLEEGDELRVGRHALRPRYDMAPPSLSSATVATRSQIAVIEASRDDDPDRIATGASSLQVPPGQDMLTILERPDATADPNLTMVIHQFGMMQQQMFDQFHNTMMMMFEGFAALHRETTGSLQGEFEQVRKLSEEIETLRTQTAKLAEAASRPPERLMPPIKSPRPADRLGNPASDSTAPIKKATPPPPDPHVDIHSQLLMRLSTMQAERQNRWQKILGMMSSKS